MGEMSLDTEEPEAAREGQHIFIHTYSAKGSAHFLHSFLMYVYQCQFLSYLWAIANSLVSTYLFHWS